MLQPVAFENLERQGEIVVCLSCRWGKAWQGGQLFSDEVDNALYQGGIVKLSSQLCFGEIAMEGNEMMMVNVARGDMELVKAIVVHPEVADVKISLSVVQVTCREVGKDISAETGISPFV